MTPIVPSNCGRQFAMSKTSAWPGDTHGLNRVRWKLDSLSARQYPYLNPVHLIHPWQIVLWPPRAIYADNLEARCQGLLAHSSAYKAVATKDQHLGHAVVHRLRL